VEEEGRQREGASAGEGPFRPRPEVEAHRLERERREHRGRQDQQVGGREEPHRPREKAGEPVLQLVLAQEVVPARGVRGAELGDRDPSKRGQVAILGGPQHRERVEGVG
jgi:hypothetical protein